MNWAYEWRLRGVIGNLRVGLPWQGASSGVVLLVCDPLMASQQVSTSESRATATNVRFVLGVWRRNQPGKGLLSWNRSMLTRSNMPLQVLSALEDP